MDTFLCFGIVFFFLLVFVFLGNSIRIVPDYLRLVVFRLGNMIGKRGPGLVLTLPFLDRVVKIDLRPFERKLEDVRMITRDNDRVVVSAKMNFNVIEPEKAALSSISVVHFGTLLEKEAIEVAQEMNSDEILQEIGRFEGRLNDRLTATASDCGIRIKELQVLGMKKVSAE